MHAKLSSGGGGAHRTEHCLAETLLWTATAALGSPWLGAERAARGAWLQSVGYSHRGSDQRHTECQEWRLTSS